MPSINYVGLGVMTVLVVLDIVLGIMRSFEQGDFASHNLRDGLLRKASYYIVIILALCLEYGAAYYPPISELAQLPIYDACVVGISAIELASIVENIVAINPDLKDAPFFSHFSGKQSKKVN